MSCGCKKKAQTSAPASEPTKITLKESPSPRPPQPVQPPEQQQQQVNNIVEKLNQILTTPQ